MLRKLRLRQKNSFLIKKNVSSDHSPVFCTFVNNDTFAHGSGVWKFNNSLLFNTDFVKN